MGIIQGQDQYEGFTAPAHTDPHTHTHTDPRLEVDPYRGVETHAETQMKVQTETLTETAGKVYRLGKGERHPELSKWEGPALQDVWSVQMQLEAGGTNFASVGINYTVTFIIESYGKRCPVLTYPIIFYPILSYPILIPVLSLSCLA